MNTRSIAVGLAAAAVLAAPLTGSGPASASEADRGQAGARPCVRITAPGNHTVAVGESFGINVRTSKACKNARVIIDGQDLGRVPGRRLRVDSAYYMAGDKTMEITVKPKGHAAVTRTLTYRVVAK